MQKDFDLTGFLGKKFFGKNEPKEDHKMESLPATKWNQDMSTKAIAHRKARKIKRRASYKSKRYNRLHP
jgi:hypothetical protein